MGPLNYNNRRFRPFTSSSNSQTTSETVFHYRQQDNILWASYDGGGVKMGHLIGIVNPNGSIDLRYHQVDQNDHLMTGTCHSIPEMLANGKLLLHESWQWTSGDGSTGSSILEEV